MDVTFKINLVRVQNGRFALGETTGSNEPFTFALCHG